MYYLYDSYKQKLTTPFLAALTSPSVLAAVFAYEKEGAYFK